MPCHGRENTPVLSAADGTGRPMAPGGRWHRVHPALYKSLGSAAGEQKGETCCQEKTCVADPTMGQRDPAREPDTEPGGVARPSEYRRAGACDEPHDSPGHRPGPSSGYRPPPDSETQIDLGKGGGEGNHECVCSGNVLVL